MTRSRGRTRGEASEMGDAKGGSAAEEGAGMAWQLGRWRRRRERVRRFKTVPAAKLACGCSASRRQLPAFAPNTRLALLPRPQPRATVRLRPPSSAGKEMPFHLCLPKRGVGARWRRGRSDSQCMCRAVAVRQRSAAQPRLGSRRSEGAHRGRLRR